MWLCEHKGKAVNLDRMLLGSGGWGKIKTEVLCEEQEKEHVENELRLRRKSIPQLAEFARRPYSNFTLIISCSLEVNYHPLFFSVVPVTPCLVHAAGKLIINICRWFGLERSQ